MTRDAATHPEQHTLLPLPNPFVIPGDRFREVYYWDSYWIIVGLLACGLCDTATGMADNLLSLVESYGFVPNGSRTYYLNRRQVSAFLHTGLCLRSVQRLGAAHPCLLRLSA